VIESDDPGDLKLTDRELLYLILENQDQQSKTIVSLAEAVQDQLATGVQSLRNIGPGLDRFFDSMIGRSLLAMADNFVKGKTNG
jgi:hypothetical protein